MLGLYEVKGSSMLPFLRSGDFVVVSRFFISIRVNDVVLVKHPIYGEIIKRVVKVCQAQGVWLKGEGIESVSSEQIGWIRLEQVQAKLLFPIKQNPKP